MKKNKFNIFIKIFTGLGVLLALLIGLFLFVYLTIIPQVASSDYFINFLTKAVKQTTNADLKLKDLSVETSLSPVIKIHTGFIKLTKNDKKLFTSVELDTEFSFKDILKHKLILNKAGSIYIYADINKIMALFPQSDKQQQTTNWKLQWFHSFLYLNHLHIVLTPANDTNIDIIGKNITISDRTDKKYLRFNISADITKNKRTIHLGFSDNDTVYMQNRLLHIDNGIINVNKSKISINATFDEKNNYNIDFFSKQFDLKNIESIIGANIIIPNSDVIAQYFKDLKGNFNFDINIKNSGLNGKIQINKAYLKLTTLQNIPIHVNSGLITITPQKILFSDFKGNYGNTLKNRLTMDGHILDYQKSIESYIKIKGNATNELTKQYLSPLIGTELTLTGDSNTAIVIQTLYNKIDVFWLFKLAKGKDILIDGNSLSPINYDRVLTADLGIEKTNLKIKSIDYYIAKVITRNSTGIKPILKLNGNIDLSKGGAVKDLGFIIPKPLPSEFLNVLIGQKIFKKGTIAGKLQYINKGNVPILNGKLEMKKVRIPSQRLSIKSGILSTTNDLINIDITGKYKKSIYNFDGSIQNNLLFPIIVKNAKLTIDNLDVEKVLNSFNQQNTNAVADVKQTIQETNSNLDNENDDNYTFNTGLIVIENSSLNIIKGNYKDIKFGNANTTMTLDRNGLLALHSNKFDFAEGISTLKVRCDLKNHDYRIRLGVKDINSDIIASTLLNLPKEISGKAKGLIILNTNDSLKLNGEMRFAIANGTITKIGLVEYIMKAASVFRNPLAMVNPFTIFDLVNIPEGNFDKISGELKLKDNIVEKIMIKSTAPELSTFIIGRYNTENNDAALRIYTKFSSKTKGLTGFLRNISLNKLANTVPLGSKNKNHYYEAELKMLPPIDAPEKDCQVFLTTVDGDLTNNNYLSSLKKIK